jgi:ankyrin repeat protein
LGEPGAGPAAHRQGCDSQSPTELAKKYGQEAVYNLLVARGGIPVDSTASAQLALVEAATKGDFEGLERAVKSGAKINGFDAGKKAALPKAVQFPTIDSGRVLTIWWLLDHGANPNLEDSDGLPLHLSVFWNKVPLNLVKDREPWKHLAEETLMRLLKAGAKVSGIDEAGRTPLHVATQCDNITSSRNSH